jgi:hypothetical protein
MFLEAVRRAWRGDPDAGPAGYVEWLVDTSYLRCPDDAVHLRQGLGLAGLTPPSEQANLLDSP